MIHWRAVRSGRGWGYVDAAAGVLAVPTTYAWAEDPVDGRARVNIGGQFDYPEDPRTALLGGHHGFLDSSGEWAIKPDYDDAEAFSEGFARVNLGAKAVMHPRDEAYLMTGGSWQVIDRDGTSVLGRLVPSRPFREGVAPARGPSRRWSLNQRTGWVDTTGAWLIPPSFSRGGDFSEGLASAAPSSRPRPRQIGWIDRTGEWAVSPRYYSAEPFSEGAAVGQLQVGGDWRWEIIDRAGTVVAALPETVRYLGPSFAEGLVTATAARHHHAGASDYIDRSRDLAIGYIDRAGDWIIPPRFKSATAFAEGLAAVSEAHSRWGYIDQAGDWVIPPTFGRAEPFRDGFARVWLGTRHRFQTCELIDRTGTTRWRGDPI